MYTVLKRMCWAIDLFLRSFVLPLPRCRRRRESLKVPKIRLLLSALVRSTPSRAERGWAMKRVIRSSCNVRCGVGLEQALSLPFFRCVIKSANRKSIFLSVNIFLKCIIITQVFDRLATLLSEFMSVLIIINISQRKLHKFWFSLKLLNVYFRLLTFFFYNQI